MTAFMEGRKKEIWLHERNLNKTTRLSEGDQFQVGPIKGTVKRINYDNRQRRDGCRTASCCRCP